MVMQVVFFLFAVSLPCLLGFVVVNFFMRRTEHSVLFCLGAGYILGWFLVTLILRIYDYFSYSFNIVELVIVELLFLVPFLFVKARQSEQKEINESPVKGITSLLFIFVSTLLLFRWGLTAIDLLIKPVFPWDGWLTWSAKAKIFYYFESIPPLSEDYMPFWSFPVDNMVSANAARHPFFISLIQTYVAMAWGTWDDNLVNLPWLGLSISVSFIVYGGLRILNVIQLPSLLTAYMVASLPMFDSHIGLGSYADVWGGGTLLVFAFLLVFLQRFSLMSLVPLIVMFALAAFLTKNAVAFFVLPMLMVVLWSKIGYKISLIVILVVAVLSYSYWGLISAQIDLIAKQYISTAFSVWMIRYNPVEAQLFQEWFVLDNWHFIFIVNFVGLLFLVLSYKSVKVWHKGFWAIILFAVSSFIFMLLITFLSNKMSPAVFTSYFNRVSLYFIPLFSLIPVSVYHLMQQKGNGITTSCN